MYTSINAPGIETGLTSDGFFKPGQAAETGSVLMHAQHNAASLKLPFHP
jgi:hypothetical protein